MRLSRSCTQWSRSTIASYRINVTRLAGFARLAIGRGEVLLHILENLRDIYVFGCSKVSSSLFSLSPFSLICCEFNVRFFLQEVFMVNCVSWIVKFISTIR